MAIFQRSCDVNAFHWFGLFGKRKLLIGLDGAQLPLSASL
ncbi:unnamed protein product [Larinioides sclopetarius]|uniref:Uncharacterized protein n=1 Tax=Larinioides sclopetarius TaxID=280406 RepID=A0AAV1ZR96_9ARAC